MPCTSDEAQFPTPMIPMRIFLRAINIPRVPPQSGSRSEHLPPRNVPPCVDFSNLFEVVDLLPEQEVLSSTRGVRMIIYGELERTEQVDEVRKRARQAVRRAAQMTPGIERHAALVSGFIRVAELVQGVADAEFRKDGRDLRTPAQEAGAALLLRAASLVDRSWKSRGNAECDIDALLYSLAKIQHEGPIRLRLSEGYAHYALYPE